MINDKIGKAIQALDNTKEYSHVVGDIDSIVWINGSTAIENSVIEAKITEMETAEANAIDLKASAKAKLIAGEALTEDEANTIVL